MKRIALFLCTFAVVALVSAGPPLLKSGESADLFEGFEGKLIWYAVAGTWKDGDNSLAVKASTAFATEGTKSLEVTFAMGEKAMATAYTEGFKLLNWSTYKAVGFDVKNASAKDLRIVCAICTGDDWNWTESKEVVVKAGETAKDLRFDFNEATWKNAQSEWKNNTTVKGLKLVQRFVVRAFGEKGVSGSYFVDNIRLVK